MKKHIHIGDFIVEKLGIPAKEIQKFLNMQDYINDKIGEMAVREGFIGKGELKEILDFQKKHKICFGNSSIYLGHMKNSQVKYLLDVQAKSKNRIGELLVRRGLVKPDQFLKVLKEYYSQKQANFTILAKIRETFSEGIRQAIKPYNYRFHTWSNEAGLASLCEKLNPHLILLDQQMGEVMKQTIKIRHSVGFGHVKIALLTDGKQEMEMRSAYEYGIDYILPAPFNPKQLINVMIDTEIRIAEKKKERILVVDDSQIVRDSVAQELGESGFQTFFAENGKEAVELAILERPNLILMDINMPVMDGYQACLELKKNESVKHIPIVILSTSNTLEEREKGFKVGATEYFTKPFDKGQLNSYINNLLSANKRAMSEKILIAEDTQLHQKIYESTLGTYGFQFDMVENGQQVLEALEKGSQPSAILLDCNMPVLNGFETCKRLKENESTRSIPVIMVTASDKKEDVVKAMNAGANDYIFKPFVGEELARRIESHIKNFVLIKNLRKEQQYLQKITERLRSAFEKAATGMALVMPDGRWLQANRSLCELVGYSGEELQGISFQDMVHPEDLDSYLSSMEQLRKGQIPQFQKEIKFIHKFQQTIWAQLDVSLARDPADTPLYFIFQIQDISQRKKSEEERARLSMAVEQTADSIIITDVDGNIQYANPAFEIHTGYNAVEIIGENPRILKSDKHDEEFYKNMWEQLTKGETWRGRVVNKKKNGILFEEEAVISPIQDSSGNIINYLAVKRDITREMMLEKQARQSQKMQAIGTLAGGIAHDFNNILTGIIGSAEMAMEDLSEESATYSHVDLIFRAGQRAGDLVAQILAFSRQSAYEHIPTQFHLILKEALNLLNASLPATIEIRERISTKSDLVKIDPTQMHQVVMNLCTNAAHAMEEEGGVMEITLEPFEVDSDITELLDELKEGKYLRFSISDTGHGMDKETLERVFEPFFTTKKTGEGTGLGLSAVHGIVEEHEGKIIAGSEPGKGSTFHVYLPRLEGKETKSESKTHFVGKGTENILFVDDEELVVQTGKKMLERRGYKVETQNDSLEALESFRADPTKFDLVITDQVMPNMTGDTLASNLMKLRPDIPIILSTGFSQNFSPEKAKSMGIKEYLLKPFNSRQLCEAIRRSLGQEPKKPKI